MNGRRRRLLGLGAAAVALAAARARADAPSSERARWLSTARVGEDAFRAVALDADGRRVAEAPLPSRAHGLAVHAGRGIGCAFARRPGEWLCTFALDDVAAARFVDTAPGRRLSGHGVYSRSGRWLYTTENDIDRGRGVIGVRDAADGYRRVAELDTHGVGPHELVRPPGTDLLVVANGGIATHPDHGGGREPLNLRTMSPSIVVVDAAEGARRERLLSRHALAPEHHRISPRHLAVDGAQRVWFAAQYASSAPPSDTHGRLDELAGAFDGAPPLAGWLPLAGRHGRLPADDRVHRLATLELPDALVPRRHAYLSSVAADARHAVFTAARDGVAFRVDVERRAVDGVVALADCSGVAPAADGFVLSSGFGETLAWRGERVAPLARDAVAWDNHLTAVA